MPPAPRSRRKALIFGLLNSIGGFGFAAFDRLRRNGSGVRIK